MGMLRCLVEKPKRASEFSKMIIYENEHDAGWPQAYRMKK
jgi:hypothetical protein